MIVLLRKNISVLVEAVVPVVTVAVALVLHLLLSLPVPGPVEVKLVVPVHPPGVGLVVLVERGGLTVVLHVLLAFPGQQDQSLQLRQTHLNIKEEKQGQMPIRRGRNALVSL